tara:strand:+ start:873 stop:1610 length:738 start_codon:yes stop_codon:yes gene_type:complete
MENNFHIIIPARIGSKRLPNKPMLKIGSQTVISRVYDLAFSVHSLSVTVATDSHEILDHIISNNGKAILTSSDHLSGLDRVNEAVKLLNLKDDEVVVNLQGDEPFMPISIISEIGNMIQKGINISTASIPLKDIEEIKNPNNVKVVTSKSGRALYFSRSTIPENFVKSNYKYQKHLGIYAYDVKTLRELSNLDQALLEKAESLEQLRFLENGYDIYVKYFDNDHPIGIDTQEDLDKANTYIQNKS